MWALKFTADSKTTTVGPLASKHSVVVRMYPLFSNKVDDSHYINWCGTVLGDRGDVSRFFKEARMMPQLRNIETHRNFFMCRYQEKPEYGSFYNPELIYIEPWTIDGIMNTHHLHLGAWNRKHLTGVIKTIKRDHDMKLLKLMRKKAPEMFFSRAIPGLTQKQKNAIEFAVQQGYYEYPRKKDLQDLARESNLSFSTFQAHLRKAERKLIPYSLHASFNDTYR